MFSHNLLPYSLLLLRFLDVDFGRMRQCTLALAPFLILCCVLLPLISASTLPRQLSLTSDSPPPDESLPPWFAPDTSTWWQRSWLRWQQWWQPSEELERLFVSPFLSDGSRAAPAELWLPPSQLRKETGLRRELVPSDEKESDDANPGTNASFPGDKGWWPKKKVPWYSYNSSDATPLVPTWLSWMADVKEMVFRADNGSLDIDVARQLSRYVAATYCNVTSLPDWRCPRCDPGFTPRRVIFDPLWDLQGMVGWSDTLNAVVIAFRGTDSHSYYNWVENMRTWRTDLALSYEGIPSHALVHGGFFYSYNSSYLAANITAAVREIVLERTAHSRGAGGGGQGGYWATAGGSDSSTNTNDDRSSSSTDEGSTTTPSAPTVFVTGHSLGGALATLCALDLKINLKLPDVRVVSFGSPRVGNYIFAKWFEQEIGPHWRFTHNRDIVPSVPPGYMGFYHVAQEVWLVDVLSGRTLVGVCDGSGEDPRCHNSVCHLGLCSSVADHLLYLSEMYSPRPHGC